jgi:hypothetical protein
MAICDKNFGCSNYSRECNRMSPAFSFGDKKCYEKKPEQNPDVSKSAFDDLLAGIMEVIKMTPNINHDYMGHGELHFSSTTDYETIERKVSELLRANSS